MTDSPLASYTDDQLLIELRRRGRIARVEASDVTPGRFVDYCTSDMQFKRLILDCMSEMAGQLGTHVAIPGATVADAGVHVPGQPEGRRMTMALNVIVEKGYGS